VREEYGGSEEGVKREYGGVKRSKNICP